MLDDQQGAADVEYVISAEKRVRVQLKSLKKYTVHQNKLRMINARNIERTLQLKLNLGEPVNSINDDEKLPEHLEDALHRYEVKWFATAETEESPQRVDAKPPSDFVVTLLTPHAVSEDFIANMEILYEEIWIPNYGLRRARMIWISQSIQLVAGYWIGKVLGLIEKLKPFILG